MNALTTFSYEGSKITFSTERGVRVNATQMAKPFNKRPVDWLRLDSTKEFINALSTDVQIPTSALIQRVRGGNGKQGTWIHEDVALEFARWLSPAFAIWCNRRIKELITAPRQESEALPLPPPEHKTLSISDLTENANGKLVTTSRKLAKLLGRNHGDILRTINANRHQRWFKYGNFTLRTYSEGKYSHGSEYLITKKGLIGLAEVMRHGAKDKIMQAYKGAWDESQAMVPVPMGATISQATLVFPQQTTDRMWSESEIIELIKAESRKMKDKLYESIQKHQDNGDTFYGPGGCIGVGVPILFEQGVADGIAKIFRHLTNVYLDAYSFLGSSVYRRKKLEEAARLLRELMN